MEFRTNFSINPQRDKVNYNDPIVTIGSCFSAMVGRRLEQGKMKVLNNPFGVIFNPISICELITTSLQGRPLPEDGFLVSNGYYYHYLTHSTLYGRSLDELKERLFLIQEEVRSFLSKASHVFITWGSSYVYEKQPEKRIVANCHKQAGSLFRKRLLTLDEMKFAFGASYAALIDYQPTIQLVLTVSPVRHIRDGIPQNQLSKSLLRVLCNELSETNGQVSYFPSYEWMIDDLRDYRFYKSDLIHPSEVAEEYIWNEFQRVYFDQKTQSLWERIHQIKRSLAHKPFHPESVPHQKFLRNLLLEMEGLLPQVDVSSEIEQVWQQLKSS